MTYRILYHNELDIQRVEKTFQKTLKYLQAGDFKSADVRKMSNMGYYRARLDIRDRLLFTMVLFKDVKHVLLLEIIKDHNYSGSRFLRGAVFPEEDKLIPVLDPEANDSSKTTELVYLNPESRSIHLLNKFISFDAIQESALSLPAPLIIIGAAGSGKTALVLEKLKSLTGNVAYISLSKFLVENASRLYYAGGFTSEDQDVEFLSLRDYLASWERPEGKETHFRAFESWFARHSQALRINEPYRVFEEFKGVITGSPTEKAWLSHEEYLGLGVKQSIFNQEEKAKLYPLFEKYLQWMKENGWYDSNIICYEYLDKIKPRYDYVMVDEVQDITNIQLKSILQSLTAQSNFILTGDSNQIVHPNFFSWSKVKSYFHDSGDAGKHVSILQTNYRNSRQVVSLSNKLLKIRNQRFGSIDRESNYLVSTVSADAGQVLLYPDEEKKKSELNRRTQNDTHFAVVVSDTIYKEEARRFFKTPLVFSIQEAKGLEYDNVILVNFISNNESKFAEIIKGVSKEDLEKEDLTYNRAADKRDKDGEIYKFYINSLYVAITRAVKNVYLFEKKVDHPALQLLDLVDSGKGIQVKETLSSREEWLEEAQRLEGQGKFEQAEQIRAKYLGYEYIASDQLDILVRLALDPGRTEQEVKKERKQLFQYATGHQRFDWIDQLAKLGFQRAVLHMKEIRQERKEFAKNVRLGRRPEVLAVLKKYGINFATEEGSTGLMLALTFGQNEMIIELLKLNASLVVADVSGLLPVDYLLQGFYKNALLKRNQIASLQTIRQFWHMVSPPAMVVGLGRQEIHIGGHSMLFFLMTLMRTMQQSQPNKIKITQTDGEKSVIVAGVFDMDDMERYVGAVPDEIVPPYRKNRSYINSVLAGNELSRKGNANCKMVFKRVLRGKYILNHDLIFGAKSIGEEFELVS